MPHSLHEAENDIYLHRVFSGEKTKRSFYWHLPVSFSGSKVHGIILNIITWGFAQFMTIHDFEKLLCFYAYTANTNEKFGGSSGI